MKKNEEENFIQKITSKKNIAFRFSLILSILIFIILIQIINYSNSNSSIGYPKYENSNYTETSLQEYSFANIGLFLEPFSWDGLGQFHTSINKTFDLNNNGPIILVLEFYSEGDKPDYPGYDIYGIFNQISFTSCISRDMLSSSNENCVSKIAIPLKSEARIYGNNLFINISCKNEQIGYNSGILTIKETSQLFVGNSLIIDSYGSFTSNIFPNEFNGVAPLGGLKIASYVQLTIVNETLLEKSNYEMLLDITYEGDISLSAILYDERNNVYVFNKNETSTNKLKVNSEFNIKKGVNYCKIEFSIYSGSLWGTYFNISITNCQVLIVESQGGFGFGFSDLEIPFFQWPSIPIVGIIILLLWIMPYSILKYREWKKIPNEIEVNILDDEEFNILDPEGLAIIDDDEFDDTFEVLEDD